MLHPFTVLLAFLLAAIAGGCGYLSSPSAKTKSSEHGAEGPQHGHKPGANGGIIATIGAEEFHVEAVLEKGGRLTPVHARQRCIDCHRCSERSNLPPSRNPAIT